MILAMIVIIAAALWGWAGFEVCRMTHRQRGLESDALNVVLPELDPVGSGR